MITLPETATMADYQRYVHELEALHGWLDVDAARNCFLMGEEVGEVFAAVRAAEKHDGRDDEAARAARDHVGEEIVDVLNYLLAIANRYGLDLEQAFKAKNLVNQGRRWD